MDENNINFDSNEELDIKKKKKKKNAELNIFQRIYKKFGFILPLLIIITLTSIIGASINLYMKKQELNQLKNNKTEIEAQLNKYEQNEGPYIRQYSQMKTAYNEYRSSLLNFELLFHTIEKYIPSDMERQRLSIKKKDTDVEITLSGKVNGYNEYVSILNVIDKCNFVDEKTKESLLNVGKVKIGGEKGEETLSEEVNFNYRFDFSTVDNKYILQKTYDNALRDFSNLSTLLKYDNIVLKKQPDKWIEDSDKDNIDLITEIVVEKNDFLESIAKIRNTDKNGYFINDTGENFINKIKTNQKLVLFYIDYLNTYRKSLKKYYDSIPEGEEVLYYTTDELLSKQGSAPNPAVNPNVESEEENTTELEQDKNKYKKVEVLNIKENIREKLLKINHEIVELYVINQYYLYLLDNNYLSTFQNIKSKPDQVYQEIVDGENVELTSEEYILYLIDNKLISEDTDIFNIIIELYPESEQEAKKQEIYTQYIQFAKDIDTYIDALIDIKKYEENYFQNYYDYNLYDIVNQIFLYYITNTSYEDEFLEDDIIYNFFSFPYTNNLLSYKNRFILNLKNNSIFKSDITKILNKEGFIKEMDNLEEFLKETDDIITYNNNNIECLIADTKKEAKEIYEGVLNQKSQAIEDAQEITELDIIIKAID